MKSICTLFIYVAIVIFLIFNSSAALGWINQEMKEQQQTVDLNSFEFNSSGMLVLKGPWEFYWLELLAPEDFHDNRQLPKKSIISLPQLWKGKLASGERLDNIGYATYRLQVISSPPNDLLALIPVTKSGLMVS